VKVSSSSSPVITKEYVNIEGKTLRRILPSCSVSFIFSSFVFISSSSSLRARSLAQMTSGHLLVHRPLHSPSRCWILQIHQWKGSFPKNFEIMIQATPRVPSSGQGGQSSAWLLHTKRRKLNSKPNYLCIFNSSTNLPDLVLHLLPRRLKNRRGRWRHRAGSRPRPRTILLLFGRIKTSSVLLQRYP